MCLGIGFVAQDAARSILDEHFSYRKTTRLLGVLRRLQTETMEDLRRATSRSSYYSDKKDLRALGLWPPSAGSVSLPALEMPPLKSVLSAEATLCDSLNTEEANENAITI
jgi:II/X family phage/plasmid replication protein